MFLTLLYAALPTLCWTLIARTRAVGIPVGLVLLAGTTVLTGHSLGLWNFRGAPELYLEYVLLGGALVLGAVLAERRLLGGPRPKPRPLRVSVATVLLNVQVGLVASLTPLIALVIFGNEGAPYGPPPSLPAGYSLSRQPGEGCGSSVCTAVWDVHGGPDLSADEKVRQLSAAVRGCGPSGWLLDRRARCVSVSHVEGRIQLNISTSDAVG
ncbi:hypothetical protein OH807_40755 [Kitasatospora sp. NBC_01560]|uniref:hypothetical protein n=1 Tax=Kitasatospora sp. NBC_01560 TaxID=2975965 RepID=UPI0038635498